MPESVAQSLGVASRRAAADARRTQVVDVFIDLVLEGHLPPSTEQVQTRAGVSAATLFRYFASLDALRRAAAARVMERYPDLYAIERLGVGGLDDRIRRFVATRVALWEKIHLLARLARTTALTDEGAAELIRFARTTMAKQVRRHFDPELRSMPKGRRETVVATIATLTSVESWEQFRHAYGHGPLQTRRAWARAIEQLFVAD